MVSAAQNNLINAALSPIQTGEDVGVAVAAKSLDAQRQAGANAVALIDAASPAGLQSGDSLVAQATGLGALVDMTA